MLTLTRLLLASACLLIAPLVVMADELPEDTNTITNLTVQEARRLVAELKGGRLSLNGLTTLDAETAKALAGSKCAVLFLNGLTMLDADTATALAKCESQWLCLDGLTTLDAATVKRLAAFKGQGLNLNGLTVLDAAKAESLAQFKGKGLSLSGLTTLDADTAKALVESVAWNGNLGDLTSLDTATAKALANFTGAELMLDNLERASFGAVLALQNRRAVWMPDHWYLLRYEIAALVGTVVFVVLAGIVVWYSRCPRDAALN